ncbi:MAG: bifunctional phosphopantothenoylcysteine decarboxylase/phosphopantothenate--cysteine ligase CoaBC [Bacteroidia bacterium]|nr:bifunctional phosphopantothenoylcysteine decarboxylase/phosphopantothenate--cysteine ligase CoaBC [Bacteroidia bacterium]
MKNFLAHKKVLLGVSASISAYKSLFLLRLLQQAEVEVKVILTPHAAKFIPPLNFELLSHQKVYCDLWQEGNYWSEHVHLANWADLFIIAPCTLNTLSKLANGICDNALLATWFACNATKVVALAMEENMYFNPITQRNLEILKATSTYILEPEEGELASGKIGKGRLAEPETILKKLNYIIAPKPLQGKKVLITAGPTQESIDPVRFISNHSSGKMGIALADTACMLGAEVTLILGPTPMRPNYSYKVYSVVSAEQMYKAVMENYIEQDILILCAAVADYKPLKYSENKIKKNHSQWELSLVKNPDILKALGAIKRPEQLLIGFALETEKGIENATQKLIEKNADMIILNYANYPNSGFSTDTNEVILIQKNIPPTPLPQEKKENVAYQILNYIVDLLN